MSAIDEAIQILNKQWYVAVTTGLGLDPSQFQLMQGNCALGTTSQSIWNITDAIPPVSVNNYFNPNSFNHFSQTYEAVINNLNSQQNYKLQELLGDSYDDWAAYRKNYILQNPDKTQIDAFSVWGKANLDNSDLNKGITYLKQKDVVSTAVDMLYAANNQYAYNITIDDVKYAISKAVTKTITMDSRNSSSDISKSWAKGSASSRYGFFSASASASWSKYTSIFIEKGFSMNATFKHVATISSSPYATKTSASAFSKFNPWFYSPALKAAKSDPSNLTWQQGNPSWDSTFGPNGNLLRLNSGLIVVDGVQTTITLDVDYSSIDQQELSASLKGGYWPFFSAEGSGGWSHQVSKSDNGKLVITSNQPEGNYTILGALVSPIDTVFGNN